MSKVQFAPFVIICILLFEIPSSQASVKTTEYIVVEDTIKLATDVYLPDGQGPFPCILGRSPYDKTHFKNDAEMFVQKGYAVVCQDTRGKFASSGVFYAFRDDRLDGLATIQWIKKQPWHNGKICGWGGSYVGYTQWAVSDALDVLTPLITTANMYDALYPEGIFSLGLAFRWGLVVNSNKIHPIAPEKMKASYTILPLSVADDSTGKSNHFTDDWLSHPYPDAYWGAMNHRAPVSAPVFSAAGWYDIFLMAQIKDFEMLGTNRHPDSHLVIGPWAHGKPATKIDFGDQADLGKHIAPMIHRFIDKFMQEDTIKVIQAPFQDKPYLLFIMQRNEWYASDQWPPRKTCFSHYYMGADEQLTAKLPKQSGRAEWTYDPADPFPSLGGTIIGNDVGTAWQNDNLVRTDQVAFETLVMDSALILLGTIDATLYISTDAPSTDIVVCLQDVFPDSNILNIQEGGTTIYNDAASSQRLQKVDVSVWATGYQIHAGHKFRVVVTSSWFPRYNRNLNTGEPIFSAKRMRAAHQCLYFGSEYPSHVTLPILAID
ncbi:CocE/NonD family hydrolase [candidate division KSB1 bacterium]|nr:CocE/NonD family hydrolase [candidate division KSB1 bacterium]